MRLWNFAKDAGEILFVKENTLQVAMNNHLAGKDLNISGVKIIVEGQSVRITGKAFDQETREIIILATGNINGISQVQDETEGMNKEIFFYTVKLGDTMMSIAQITMGKAFAHHRIFEANKPILTQPDQIYVGQVLRIPTHK